MTISTAPLASAAAVGQGKPERERIRGAAEAFESLLLENLIHSMKEGQLSKGFFGGGTGTSIYEALMERNLAEHLSRRSPLGLADVLEERWSQHLETPEGSDTVRREIEAGRGLTNYRRELEGVNHAPDRPPRLKKPAE